MKAINEQIRKRWISLYVENDVGVLARIAGLFSGKSYNLSSLTVGETEDPTVSRMTISLYGDDKTFEQIKKQLNRSVEVIKVLDFTDLPIHKKELLFLRLHSLKREETEEVFRSASVFGITVCDYDRGCVLLESVKNCASESPGIIVGDSEISPDIFIYSLEGISGQFRETIAVGVDNSGGIGSPVFISVGGHSFGAAFILQPGDDFGFFAVSFKRIDFFNKMIVGRIGQFPNFATLQVSPVFFPCVPDGLFDGNSNPFCALADIMELCARVKRKGEFRCFKLKLPFTAVDDPLSYESKRFKRLWLPAHPPLADDGCFRDPVPAHDSPEIIPFLFGPGSEHFFDGYVYLHFFSSRAFCRSINIRSAMALPYSAFPAKSTEICFIVSSAIRFMTNCGVTIMCS